MGLASIINKFLLVSGDLIAGVLQNQLTCNKVLRERGDMGTHVVLGHELALIFHALFGNLLTLLGCLGMNFHNFSITVKSCHGACCQDAFRALHWMSRIVVSIRKRFHPRKGPQLPRFSKYCRHVRRNLQIAIQLNTPRPDLARLHHLWLQHGQGVHKPKAT